MPPYRIRRRSTSSWRLVAPISRAAANSSRGCQRSSRCRRMRSSRRRIMPAIRMRRLGRRGCCQSFIPAGCCISRAMQTQRVRCASQHRYRAFRCPIPSLAATSRVIQLRGGRQRRSVAFHVRRDATDPFATGPNSRAAPQNPECYNRRSWGPIARRQYCACLARTVSARYRLVTVRPVLMTGSRSGLGAWPTFRRLSVWRARAAAYDRLPCWPPCASSIRPRRSPSSC